eukprot:6463854-Amphidinium_carterae.1
MPSILDPLASPWETLSFGVGCSALLGVLPKLSPNMCTQGNDPTRPTVVLISVQSQPFVLGNIDRGIGFVGLPVSAKCVH